MMYLFFLLFLLGHRVQGEEKSCWHDPCDQNDLEGKKVTNGDAEVEAVNPEACQQKCVDYPDKECKWFDFGGMNHPPKKCVLLKDKCNQKHSENNEGVSGPVDCDNDPDPAKTCKYSPGARTWECIHNDGNVFSPQPDDDLLEGTTCKTSCYGNKYTAKCGSAGWDKLESNAKDDDSAHKTEIESPEKGGDCLCKKIKLDTDPNREPGAFFFCSEKLQFCQGSGTTTDINKGVCTLSCEGYQYVTFHCSEGAWYKDDEEMDDSEIGTLKDDLYCYDATKTACPPEE